MGQAMEKAPDAAPWIQIGRAIPADLTMEAWAHKAGFNWSICETPVRFMPNGPRGSTHLCSFPEHKVLYRSDTKQPLSVVGYRYQVVQPKVVLEFYRDLIEIAGCQLETAGILKEGRKLWALAKTGKEARLKGEDLVQGYLLLATSCDGSLATTATPTTIRVACQNTLAIALNNARHAVKVPHSTTFDAEEVKRQLGVAVSGWDSFIYAMRTLAERKVRSHEAMNYFLRVFSSSPIAADPGERFMNDRAIKRVQQLYDGAGRGSELSAAKGTAWGLLNAVTEWCDYERRARSPDHRVDSAWFGQGAALKERALNQALQMAS